MPFRPAQKLDTHRLAGYFFHSYDKFTRVSPRGHSMLRMEALLTARHQFGEPKRP
jgi:hypothetical protein